MRKLLLLSTFIVSCLCMTSCLDVFEDIIMHKDGSGQYSIRLSIGEKFRSTIEQALEEQKDALANAKTESETSDVNNQDDNYKASLDQIVNKLKNVKGLSNIDLVYKETEFEYGYSFDFSNVEALNEALKVTAGEFQPKLPSNIQLSKKKTITPSNLFIEFGKGLFVRHQTAELGKLLELKNIKNTGGSNAGVMGGLDVTYLLQDMNYVSTFTFDQTVKSTNNDASVIDENGKKVTIKCRPFEYPSTDFNQLKLQEIACSPSIVVELK